MKLTIPQPDIASTDGHTIIPDSGGKYFANIHPLQRTPRYRVGNDEQIDESRHRLGI